MTKEQYAEWKEKNGTESERVYINDIAYNFVKMNDEWIAVFSVRNGEYIPIIQAQDRVHAVSFCRMREPVNVPVNII